MELDSACVDSLSTIMVANGYKQRALVHTFNDSEFRARRFSRVLYRQGEFSSHHKKVGQDTPFADNTCV